MNIDIKVARDIANNVTLPEYIVYDDNIGQIDYDEVNIEGYRYRLNSGATKLAIILKDFPFVLKVPAEGSVCPAYDEYGNPVYDESDISGFYGAEDGEYGDDYCLAEYRISSLMSEAGFSQLAPKTECLGYINGHEFYAQEKILPYGDAYGASKKVSETSMASSNKMEGRYRVCATEWRAAVIEQYGEQYWRDFVDWADDISTTLSDMHGNNYGYRESDGSPCLLDLGGYNE